MALLSLLIAWAAGLIMVRAARPCAASAPVWAKSLLEALLGLAAGLGGTSALYFVLLWIGLNPIQSALAGDAAFAVLGLFALWLRRGQTTEGTEDPIALQPAATPQFRWTWVLSIAFAIGLALFVAGQAAQSSANPQGGWDAWAIWNLRAKFLSAPGAWHYAVSPELGRTHPEYPLLWSGVVARAWSYGTDQGSTRVPSVAAIIVAAAIPLLLVAALSVLRSTAQGILGGLVLLTVANFWDQSSNQYADVPLAYFIVCSLAAAVLSEERQWNPGALALSGFLASLAAWTKNEGMVFLAAMALAVIVAARRHASSWLVAAAPVTLLVAAFKILLAPRVDVLSVSAVFDLGRLFQAVKGLFTALVDLGSLPAHPIILACAIWYALRFRKGRRGWWPLAPALTLLLADCFVLAGTRNDLEWAVGTAMDRLVLQILPATLLALFLQLHVPVSAYETVKSSKRARRKG